MSWVINISMIVDAGWSKAVISEFFSQGCHSYICISLYTFQANKVFIYMKEILFIFLSFLLSLFLSPGII